MTSRDTKKIWLSYAWKDNEDQQVAWIVQELEKQGLEVHLDNRDIVPGHHLWEQIAAQIADPSVCDAWVYVVTPNSLASQACREELAYALDRALSSRGVAFPLLGLVDGKFSTSDLPAALRIRLFVSTYETNWRERVAAGVRGIKPGALPGDELPSFISIWHRVDGKDRREKDAMLCLEIRPRAGSWAPFVAAVPLAEKSKLLGIRPGPKGAIPQAFSMVGYGTGETADVSYWGMSNEISPAISAFIMFREKPSKLLVGQEGALLTLTFG